jgi:ferric-dicitrate binding protein FerR (iron transport regulator)
MERIWSLKGELRFSDKQEIERAYRQFIKRVKNREGKRINFYTVFKYAAIVVIVSLLSLNLYEISKNTVADENSSKLMNVIKVPRGEHVEVLLSDGTKVSLNSDTKFIYPSHFSEKVRNVLLVGEGFFEVSHDAHKPFVVNSKLIHVTVLGTKFNMRTYPNENSVVTLSEGKVEIESSNKENKMTLHPNEEATYSESLGMTLSKGVDVEISKSWMKGELAFMDKPLSAICKDLERKYNVKIIITDLQLAGDIYTCHFKENATIEQVMSLLRETRKLDYSSKNGQIIIYKFKNNMPMGKK